VLVSQSLNHISTWHVLKISASPQSYASFVNSLFKGWLIYGDSFDGSPWPSDKNYLPFWGTLAFTGNGTAINLA